MAVSAKFIADFSDFNSAVERATVKIREFGTEPYKVENALSRMADGFSGRKLIADATLAAEAVERIGGTSRLTEEELRRVATQAAAAADKLRLMGEEVPPKLQALAARLEPIPKQLSLMQQAGALLTTTFGQMTAALSFTNLLQGGVSTLASWTREAFTAADANVNLAGTLGTTTEFTQRLQGVADQTSTSLDALGGLALQLQLRWESNRRSVEDLGLAWATLNAQPFEARWGSVVEALGHVTDAQERNRLGTALMGKQFEALAPAVVEGFKQMADGVTVAGDAQVRALDRAGDAWDKWVADRKANLRNFLGDLVLAGEGVGQVGFFDSLSLLLQPGGLTTAPAILAEIAAASKRIGDVSLDVAGTAKAMHDYAAELRDAKKESAELTGEQLKQIRAAQELGVSTKQLAEEYDVSEAAIKRLNEQTKLQQELLGTGVVQKATDLLDALQALDRQGLRPTATGFDAIVSSMEAAQRVMESTGQAGERLYGRLEEARRRFSGLTPEGLIPQIGRNANGGSAFTSSFNLEPPNLPTEDLESNGMLQDARARLEMEQALQAAMEAHADALGEETAAYMAAGEAAEASTSTAIKGYGGLKQAALEAAAALKVAVPPGFDWTQAYKDAGFFVNDAANRRPAATGGYWGDTALQGATIHVDARDANFDDAAAVERMADRVFAALQQRMGK